MGLFVTGKTHGLLSRLNSASAKYEDALEREIDKAAKKIERRAKRLAPSDDGVLRGMIESKTTKEGSRVVGIVKSGAKYSAYLEFGTGLFVDPILGVPKHWIVPKNKRFLAWPIRKKDRSSGKYTAAEKKRGYAVRPRVKGIRRHPFMRPAYNEEVPNLIKAVRKIKVLS